MTEIDALRLLADRVGAEAGYHDVVGTWHTADDEDRRTVLTAMGFDVSTPDAAVASLAEFEAKPWRRALEPVTVLRDRGQSQYTVTVNVPLTDAERPLRWSITLEGGGQRKGEVLPIRLRRAERREVEGKTLLRVLLDLPGDLPQGYHRLNVKGAVAEDKAPLIIAPPHAYRPAWQEAGLRHWGVAAHLYAVRDGDDWGMGDFTTLTEIARTFGPLGAQAIGINPLHALFPDKPEEASPYSPSNRLFMNPLYIDVTAVPEWNPEADAKGLTKKLAALRAKTHVDYSGVAAVKWPVLEKLHKRFAALPEEHPRKQAFHHYRAAMGGSVRRYAVFFSLREKFPNRSWRDWPEDYESPATKSVQRFAMDHEDRVDFHEYLQFEADRQLSLAAAACREAGMAVGLYRDLAVGSTPDGSAAWGGGNVFAQGIYFGAPPDAFNPKGQDWGLPPYNPLRLRETGYAPFIALLRDNMRHAGALRIDHAMSLMRLFWIMPGQGKGAYVRYPIDDLLGIIALESVRQNCLVIGEDLGTVPPEFRHRMDEENLLSYRLFYFERWETGLFKRPGMYPSKALATATTHDLATLEGFWEEKDQGVMHDLHILSGSREDAAKERQKDRETLVAAMVDQHLLPADFPTKTGLDSAKMEQMSLAVHAFLARSPAALMLINLDDAGRERMQLNVPGTIFEYPNWRRRLSLRLHEIAASGFARRLIETVARERARPKDGTP